MADVSKFLRKINSGLRLNLDDGFDVVKSLVVVSKSNPLVMLSGDLKYKLGFNFNSNGKGVHSGRFKSLVSIEFDYDKDSQKSSSKIIFQYELEDGTNLVFEGAPSNAISVLKNSLSNFSEVCSDKEGVYSCVDEFEQSTNLFSSISEFCLSVELMLDEQFK